MDLLEKFDSVQICTDSRISEADRQFFQRQQAAYEDAVAGFYQIAALWMDMCAQQKAALYDPEAGYGSWKKKYLESRWWPEITVKEIVKHVFKLHRDFISTITDYLNATYFLSLRADNIEDDLLPEEPSFEETKDAVDWDEFPPFALRYEDVVELVLAGFNGRTFEEQAPYELVENCHRAAWDESNHAAKFERKKSTIKILSGACGFGYHKGYEQWYFTEGTKSILKALAYFETGGFEQYPDGLDDLILDEKLLWYDLWELESCKKLEQIKLFKNGRMDIRFTNEGYAREFVAEYLGTVS